MSILYGIAFIAAGAWAAFYQTKLLLKTKRNYFSGSILILLWIACISGGIMLIISKTGRFPYDNLLYVVTLCISFIAVLIQAIARRSTSAAKHK